MRTKGLEGTKSQIQHFITKYEGEPSELAAVIDSLEHLVVDTNTAKSEDDEFGDWTHRGHFFNENFLAERHGKQLCFEFSMSN